MRAAVRTADHQKYEEEQLAPVQPPVAATSVAAGPGVAVGQLQAMTRPDLEAGGAQRPRRGVATCTDAFTSSLIESSTWREEWASGSCLWCVREQSSFQGNRREHADRQDLSIRSEGTYVEQMVFN